MMNTKDNQIKSVQIEQQQFEEQQDEQELEMSQSISSEGSVKQKAVFQIFDEQHLLALRNKQVDKNQQNQNEDEQSPELDQDQREAFLYLLQVRKEKKIILQEKKKRKILIKNKDTKINEVNVEQKQKVQVIQIQTVKQNKQNLLKDNFQSKQSQYSDCILKNFNIVVQNVKYLIKSDENYSHNNKKFNAKLYESIKLQNQPLIYNLIKLTIGQIQDAIRKLSFQINFGPKIKKLQNKQNQNDGQLHQIKKPSIVKYSLWIYSLLALHQSWSAYKHFQSLAQINFVLTSQITHLDNLSYDQKKSILLLFLLMINIFEQKHLKKYLQQIMKSISLQSDKPIQKIEQAST